MPRRIDVELTSERADGTWTWRAAGAKQPKGEVAGELLFSGAKVGDVVRADADFDVDGITIVAVQAPKDKPRNEPERIEVLGTVRAEPGVTTTLVEKGRRRDRGDRGRGRDHERDREGRRGTPRDGDRRDRRGERPDEQRERRPRRERPPRPPVEAKPKPKRLRPARTHRQAVVAALPEEHKPIAEQVLRGGIPAVRQAIDKQNEENKAAGKPAINAAPLIAIAEDLTPSLRAAEWQDRAEAALAEVDELDLRDLRSVVVASDAAAKDDDARALADQLRSALSRRVEAEHTAWLAEIDELLRDGRVVRALRVSSRPPKAGAPFPADLGTRLADDTAAALTSDTSSERYATVIDALAYAPVRQNVQPRGVPEKPSDELRSAVERLGSRLPQVAAAFGIEAKASSARPPRGPRRPRSSSAPVPPPPPRPEPEAVRVEPAPSDDTTEPGTAPDATTAAQPAAPEAPAEPVTQAPAEPVTEG